MKGKICFIAKFHMTDLLIWGHSREGKTLSYSRRNMLKEIIPELSSDQFIWSSDFHENSAM